MLFNSKTELQPASPDSMAVKDLLSAFLSGRNSRTIEAYRIDLEYFRQFTQVEVIDEAIRLIVFSAPGQANHLVLKFRAHLQEKGMQATTINRRLATIRSLVKLARMLGLVIWSLEVPNLKVQAYRNTQGPGQNAVVRMVEEVRSRKSPKAVRDYAIMRLLYDLALRASEITSLDLLDVDLKGSTVAVMGKGNTQKVHLALSTSTRAALVEWIDTRGIEPGPLFTNFDRANKGNRLTRTGLYQIVRRLGETVDIRTRPHGIRHTAITQAIRVAQVNGITLPEVKQFSRHASLQTLQIYADNERNVQGQLSSLLAEALPGKKLTSESEK